MDTITCPNCWQLNLAGASTCRRCRRDLTGVKVDRFDEDELSSISDKSIVSPLTSSVMMPSRRKAVPMLPKKSIPPYWVLLIFVLIFGSPLGLIIFLGRGLFQQSDGQAVKHYNRGLELQRQGELDSAIAQYDQAISLNPELAIAFTNRGVAYGYLGDFDQAIADLDQAITLDPEMAIAYGARGEIYWLAGNLAKAISDVDRAIDLDPELARAYAVRGQIYVLENVDQTIADAEKAIDLDPKLKEAYLIRGVANSLKGEFKDAETDFNDAISLDRMYAEAYFWRGLLRADEGNVDKAISDLWLALELGLTNPELKEFAEDKLEELRLVQPI